MGLASPSRAGIGLPSGRSAVVPWSAQRTALVGLLAEGGHGCGCGQVHDAQAALEQSADVLADGPVRQQRVGSLGIGQGHRALAVGDVEPLVGRIESHRRRIPAHGDEAERPGLARFADIEDRQIIGIGIGHEQHLAVRRQGQAVWRISLRSGWVQGTGDGLRHGRCWCPGRSPWWSWRRR